MIPLDYAGTRKLQLITAQNGADVAVAFSDFDTTTEDYARGVPTLTTIASATTTDICATPASGKIRDVEFVNVKNTYAGSHAITLQIASGAGGPFVLAAVTLAAAETLRYVHGLGIQVLDANGALKMSIPGVAVASGKTLTVSNSLTLAGTDGTTMTFPAVSGNVALYSSMLSNALSGDVSLNNTANYFDGPSVAQGTSGTWVVAGSITMYDTANAADFGVKLWDGTTVFASGATSSRAAGSNACVALAAVVTNPVGNLRIAARDFTSTNGAIRFNATVTGKDSTITAYRVA